MKKRSIILLVIILPLLLLAACGGAAGDEYLAAGDKAPDFTLPDTAGGTYTLSEHLGEKPVLLYFSMADG